MSTNPMVGAVDGIDFQQEQLQLDKGDALVMFTDGVTEAMNVTFEEFSENRLEETLSTVVMHSGQEIIDTVKNNVSTFTDGAEQSDDITLLTIRRL
jgi:sigma-B regulation protein RsbU (phosphoserine phosphatase)